MNVKIVRLLAERLFSPNYSDDAHMDDFGLTLEEVIELRSVAQTAMDAEKSILSRRILDEASPDTSTRIRDAFAADWLRTFSKAGQSTLVLLSRDLPEEIQSLKGLLRNFLVDPVVYQNIAAWCFHFALQESSATFQLDHCPRPTREGQLSGLLLATISQQCEKWREVAAEPLDRKQITLSLSNIDLSIRGGEQATGGDFGIVLEFDAKGTQPAMQTEAPGVRIVPLIFQAKRYVRPMADVSQHHVKRGHQHALLGQNRCAAAYVFYENSTKVLDRPAPTLIKPVAKVSSPTRTAVFDDSLDLPSYLFKALYDSSFAPGASSPEEALRMIYPNADAGQLGRLAVISNSSTAGERYAVALAKFNEERRSKDDQQTTEDPLTH